MNRKEAKRKRTALVFEERDLAKQFCKPCPHAFEERDLAKQFCKPCPHAFDDIEACKLCPTYVKLNVIGKEIDEITVKYRKANKIKTYGMTAKEFEKRGTYNDFKEIAEQHGVGRITFNKRVAKGMSGLEAATTPPRQNKILTDEHVATAKQNGISRTHVTNRLNSGWSLEDAITVPVKNRGPNK